MDDKYIVDEEAPTILRTEKIRFEEEGKMNRIKLRMDSYRGGRFFIFTEDKKKPTPEPIKGAINSPKNKEDVFDKEDDNAPF